MDCIPEDLDQTVFMVEQLKAIGGIMVAFDQDSTAIKLNQQDLIRFMGINIIFICDEILKTHELK